MSDENNKKKPSGAPDDSVFLALTQDFLTKPKSDREVEAEEPAEAYRPAEEEDRYRREDRPTERPTETYEAEEAQPEAPTSGWNPIRLAIVGLAVVGLLLGAVILFRPAASSSPRAIPPSAKSSQPSPLKSFQREWSAFLALSPEERTEEGYRDLLLQSKPFRQRRYRKSKTWKSLSAEIADMGFRLGVDRKFEREAYTAVQAEDWSRCAEVMALWRMMDENNHVVRAFDASCKNASKGEGS